MECRESNISKSTPETPARSHLRPIRRTAPDSHRKVRISIDDNGLDLIIINHKLQLYQLEMEEARLRSDHRRTLAQKEAADVAAAARFRSELDRQQRFEKQNFLDNDFQWHLQRQQHQQRVENPRLIAVYLNPSDIAPFENHQAHANSGLKRPGKPEALNLSTTPVPALTIQSASLPTRRSSLFPPSHENAMKQRRRSTIATRESPNKHSLPLSLNAITEADIAALSIETSPAQSESSVDSDGPRTPVGFSSLQEELQRELELFAYQQGPNVQNVQLSRKSSRFRRRANLSSSTAMTENTLTRASSPGPLSPAFSDDSAHKDMSVSIVPIGKRSILRLFDRKDTVDDVLDLYLQDWTDDETIEQKKKTRRPSLFWRRPSVPNLAG